MDYKDKETDLFKLVQTAIDYNSKTGYYTRSDLHWSFYNSDQWRGIPDSELPKIVLNIVKQTINYKIASIMSQNIGVNYVANGYDEVNETNKDAKNYADMLTSMIKVKWEKEKMNTKIREALLNGAVTGDMVFYTYWDSNVKTGQLEIGDSRTKVIDGANVFFADANSTDTESQEWIIVSGRASVKSLRQEAIGSGISEEEAKFITGDNDTEYQPGQYGKIEMDYGSDEGKATYYIKFWKKDGNVYWCKKTRYATIRESVDMGIKRYPVNFRNWETVKNSMHGMDEARGVIPNQISINQLHALTVLWMRKNAFGKTVVDTSRIRNWTNNVSGFIASDGDLTGAVQQLQAGNFNQAIVSYMNILMDTTKNVIGANDAALGQVNPTNTSAIAVTVKQSSIPLENIQANVYQLVEDWALTEAEFIMAKYNKRDVQVEAQGKKGYVRYEKPAGDVMLSVNVEVGPSSYYSEIAGQGTLDNLFGMGKLTDKQYFERMKAFNVIPDVEGLIKDIEAKEEAEKSVNKTSQLISQMSPEAQAQFNALSPEEQQAMLQKIGGVQ